MEKNVIVANLLKNAENKKLKNVGIKSVTVTKMDNYVRLGLKLDTEIDGFVAKEDGTYDKGKTDIIFISTYSVGAVLRDNDEASFAVGHMNENPSAYVVILTGAKIDILQEYVHDGDVYVNPFASDTSTEGLVPTDHDMIINHIIEVKLTDRGKALLDRIADKMLGF